MSAQSQNPDNIYTQQVKHLLSLVYPQESGFGSIFEDARHYFSLSTTLEQHTADLKAQLLKLKDRKDKEVLAGQLTQQIKNNTQKLEEERLARLERLETVCSKIISLCEGET